MAARKADCQKLRTEGVLRALGGSFLAEGAWVAERSIRCQKSGTEGAETPLVDENWQREASDGKN